MKTLTTYKKYMTADLYEWTGSWEDRQYTTTRSITLSCHMDNGTTLRVFTDEPLQPSSRLGNIRDRFGKAMYPGETVEGMIYEVFMTKPIVTPWQSAEGFENRAKRIQ